VPLSLAPAVTCLPRRFCFRGMTELLNAPRFRVASRRRASRSRVLPLAHRPDCTPCLLRSRPTTPADEPDEQLTPRRSGDDPWVRPDEPVLWSGRVRAGHASSPGGPRSGPRRTGPQNPVTGCMPMSVPPCRFRDWLTGRQCTCTTRHPSQQRVSTRRGSQALSTPRWR
jgi:hypothetical protein